MLVAATNKEISDLKQQVEVLSSADSQRRIGQSLEPAMMEKQVCGTVPPNCKGIVSFKSSVEN